MQVETYECSETAAEPLEATEEAMGIIEQLGLEGQQRLIAPHDPGEFAKRIPYREATKTELWVFGNVCPHACTLEEYAASPIPLRVLQVAAHAKSLKYFDHLIVWAADPATDPDPVLLGLVDPDYSPTKRCLLARWGDVLDDWPALLNRAAEIFRVKVKTSLVEIKGKIAQRERELDELDPPALADTALPSYYN